jgi:tetratricopeptide (TPR) repeat protein
MIRTLPAFVLSASLLFGAAADLQKLRDREDRAALDHAAASLQQGADKSPNDANAQYRAAVAWSYAAEVAMELRDKNAAEHAAEQGVKDAEKAVSLNGRSAEYYRILGTLCGQVIPANPILGALSYGRRAKEALDKAIELDPKSSSAFVSHGVGNYYLPASFGGGPDNAIKDFRRAIELDAKNADAYLWLGLALRKTHQDPQAREAFEKSLQLDPDRVWTKQQLEKTPAR